MISFLDNRLPERFWSKCLPEPMSGCWLWHGAHTDQGYGQIKWEERIQYAHRVSFEILVERFSEPHLDHLCRVRCCVNPAHLEPVSAYQNTMRGIGVTSLNAAKTHCKRGHDLSAARIQVSRRGEVERVCRHCRVLRAKGVVL